MTPERRLVLAQAKCLASERRLAILDLLAEGGELPAAEISRRVGVSQPAGSQHLQKLYSAGLAERRRSPDHRQEILYSLTMVPRALLDYLETLTT